LLRATKKNIRPKIIKRMTTPIDIYLIFPIYGGHEMQQGKQQQPQPPPG